VSVGVSVGVAEGSSVGHSVLFPVGAMVGKGVDALLGDRVAGSARGWLEFELFDGTSVGKREGTSDGERVVGTAEAGIKVGDGVGACVVGNRVGKPLGGSDGDRLGNELGP
jgi:hypothetical protein